MKKYLTHLICKTICTPNFIRRIEWRKMLDWLEPKEGERILDVACGWGALSLKIAEKGCEVYGIDTSEHGVKYAKRLAEIDRAKLEPDINIWMNYRYRRSLNDCIKMCNMLWKS